jgi:hypothetical protein
MEIDYELVRAGRFRGRGPYEVLFYPSLGESDEHHQNERLVFSNSLCILGMTFREKRER